MATLKESYNDTDEIDSVEWIDSSKWSAQTFTASTDYSITGVKLVINWYDSIPTGNVTVSIRATTTGVLGTKPTGNDLCSGTVACSSLPEHPAKTWTEITFTAPYNLAKGTVYAIVVRIGVASPDIAWRRDASSPTYSGGNYADSGNSGTTWTDLTSIDFMFETYGNFTPPSDIIAYKRLITAGNNEIWYEDI